MLLPKVSQTSPVFFPCFGGHFENGRNFMKFCPVVPEICHGHVHVTKKERRIIIIIIIITRYDSKRMLLRKVSQTLLVFFRVLATILKMDKIFKILKMHTCSSNDDLSLCQILCLYNYPFRSYQH
jgi:hypothetical protein